MSIKIQIIILTCILASSGCTSTKKMIDKSDLKLSGFSSEVFIGTYRNTIDSVNTNSLWKMLNYSYDFPRSFFKNDMNRIHLNTFVKLDIIDNKILRAQLLSDSVIASEIQLKGKLKGDFFSLKRNLLIVPIPLFMIYSQKKILIGNSEDRDLVLVEGINFWGAVGGIVGGNSEIKSFKFNRINN